MYRAIMLMIVLGLTSLACNLSGSEPTTAPATVAPTPITVIITATPDTSATVTATPTATRTTNGGNGVPCTIRTDWSIYTVAAGDTLGVIAGRTGSDTNTLTAANCLSNPNSIRVGQQLRVPRMPATNTPRPTTQQPSLTPTVPPAKGMVQFSPYVRTTEGGYELTPNAWTTVSWGDYARGYYGIVEFFLFVPEGGMQRIGSDENLDDGAQFMWLVPANLRGQVQAVFTQAGGVQAGVSYLTTVLSTSAPVANGFPLISSYISADAGNFQLRPGKNIQIAWQEAPTNAFAIDFIYTQLDGATSVIGSDRYLADGAKIDWVVPNGMNGKLSALAFGPDALLIGQSYTQNIYSAP